jgi:hypothetical protein
MQYIAIYVEYMRTKQKRDPRKKNKKKGRKRQRETLQCQNIIGILCHAYHVGDRDYKLPRLPSQYPGMLGPDGALAQLITVKLVV